MLRVRTRPTHHDRRRRLTTALALFLGWTPALIAAGPRDLQGSGASAARSVEYLCGGGQRLSVTFEGKTAPLVDPSGRHAMLDQRPAASGIFFEAAGESLRGKGQELTWSRTGAPPLTCRTTAAEPLAQAPGAPDVPGLSGTRWQLVQFQSSDDAIGTTKPQDPTRFTLELTADGRVAMRIDCNRATGRWSAAPTSPKGGSLSLGPLAATRAACPGPLADRLAADGPRVQSYTLAGDTLNLALLADAGVYTWRRAATRPRASRPWCAMASWS
jgi:heat shock protein HslJ